MGSAETERGRLARLVDTHMGALKGMTRREKEEEEQIAKAMQNKAYTSSAKNSSGSAAVEKQKEPTISTGKR
jgi:hypothetical protein